MTGVIIKALSGFYYISCGGEIRTCKAKGKFRHDGLSPLVGDVVDFDEVVENVRPRVNSFIRPAVANIDALVFVASASKPVTDPFLIDRMSVIAEKSRCEFILCLNKTDEVIPQSLYDIYASVPYSAVMTSALTGEGIDELKSAVHGKKCAFTGNSGVGKSSILNCIIPEASIETMEISDKLGRGKHTTRHVEFYPVDETTFIADTPGFASFDIEMVDHVEEEELQHLFPEFGEYIGNCRFSDCRHINEPDCTVKAAVQAGRISASRYDSYVRLYEVVSSRRL